MSRHTSRNGCCRPVGAWHGGPASVDVVVVNTCTVTQGAAHQSRQEVRKAVRHNPGAFVVVTGCHAQLNPDELASIAGVGMVYGNHAKGQLPDVLIQAKKSRVKTTACARIRHTPGL